MGTKSQEKKVAVSFVLNHKAGKWAELELEPLVNLGYSTYLSVVPFNCHYRFLGEELSLLENANI